MINGGKSKIKKLKISATQFQKPFFAQPIKMEKLELLALKACGGSGDSPEKIEHVFFHENTPFLTTFLLVGLRLTETDLERLCKNENLKHLKSLTLKDVGLDDNKMRILAKFEGLQSLEHIDLGENSFSDTGIGAIAAANFALLKSIDFSAGTRLDTRFSSSGILLIVEGKKVLCLKTIFLVISNFDASALLSKAGEKGINIVTGFNYEPYDPNSDDALRANSLLKVVLCKRKLIKDKSYELLRERDKNDPFKN